MTAVTILLDEFTKLSMDHLNALIALGALGLAGFAIFAVLAVTKAHEKK
jgi:hypothetical protein